MRKFEPALNVTISKLNIVRFFFILLMFVLIFTLSVFVSWLGALQTNESKTIYFSEHFDKDISLWETADGEAIADTLTNSNNKVLKLSSKKYLAPYAMHEISEAETPPDTFVFHFKVYVNSFTDNSLTLASMQFSTQPIAIVVDQQGRIGLAHQMFNVPEYSVDNKYSLKKNQWQDIYLSVNAQKHVLELYLGSVKILSEPYTDLTYPLHELWLGTIWVKGGGNYGVPIDIRYDDVIIGDEGIIPKPTFFEYVYSLL